MKNFFSHQIKGIVWFVILYALLRTGFSFSEYEVQSKEIFAIFLTSIALVCLCFSMTVNNNPLAINLSFLSLSAYSLFTWTKFDFGILSSSWFQEFTRNDDKIALLVVLFLFVVALSFSVFSFIDMFKKGGKKIWLIAPSFLIVITAIIFSFDFFLF